MAGLYSVPAGIGPAVRRFGPSLLRLAVGVTVLWFLARQGGAALFEDGLRVVTWQAVVAAVTLTALTTVCSAWRWRVAARALGAGMGAVAARGKRASRDGPIRRRGRWMSLLIDRLCPVTGLGTPLTAPASWCEAERLAP